MFLLEPRIVRIALKQLDTSLHHSKHHSENDKLLESCSSAIQLPVWGWETLVKSEKNLTWTLRQDDVFLGQKQTCTLPETHKKKAPESLDGWKMTIIYHIATKKNTLDVVLGVWMLGNTSVDFLIIACGYDASSCCFEWRLMMTCTFKNKRSECDVSKTNSEPFSCIRVIPLIAQGGCLYLYIYIYICFQLLRHFCP